LKQLQKACQLCCSAAHWQKRLHLRHIKTHRKNIGFAAQDDNRKIADEACRFSN